MFSLARAYGKQNLLDCLSIKIFCILALMLFLGSESLHEVSFAADEDALTQESETIWCGKSSPLWYSFIRQAMPENAIHDPKQRHILLGYRKRDWQPLFFDSSFRLTSDAMIFIERLKHLKSEAINPAPYHVKELLKDVEKLEQLRASLRCNALNPLQTLPRSGRLEAMIPSVVPSGVTESDPNTILSLPIQFSAYEPGDEPEQRNDELFRTASAIEVSLIKDLCRYAKEMHPSSHHELTLALWGEISVTELLTKLESNSPHYASVRKALAKYEQLTREHPFKTLNLPKLRLGSKGHSVHQLQKRLFEEGFSQGKADGTFDEKTKQAVERFQLAHQLNPDGVVGAQTNTMLNISYDEKLKMVTKTLKLLRESRSRSYDRFVRVNIPQFVMEYYKEKKIKGTYRVIVGKSSGKMLKGQEKMIGVNQTPTLTSAIQQLIFNPRWYVSDRIRLELNNVVRQDPSYFSRNGYVATSGSYPWGEPRLYQRPGPNNPLGRVKFEFPNRYAVYLHDTPKKQLFQQIRRDFSHGCIRLEKAVDFAQALLADDENQEARKVERYLTSDRQVYVKLAQPVPIIIEYVPVSSDGKGQVIFCGDPYGWFDEDTG